MLSVCFSNISAQEEKPPKKELKPCAKRHWDLSTEPKTIKKAIKKSKKRSRTQKEAMGNGRRLVSAYGDGHGGAHEHGNRHAGVGGYKICGRKEKGKKEQKL